ncbi:DNA alkylation repair protein [Massilia pseudoviolaceinigra]|uniref:DNA alkylation repair protein n=1 Tax=Massilia pseudoviolaceinigra TaxID=3057165 RepID=UPI0027966639|nr:DNA alkylation repair protein [Massilia sp. CCM 9206]MDQ1921606.1 DNA alkylation repair protein [Massilia sp. CCM 9206]
MSIAEEVKKLLAPLADPARAAAMSAYMRGQFAFYGIPTPARRAALKPLVRSLKGAHADVLLDAAGALWTEPQRECQYAAIDPLAAHAKQFDGGHIAPLLALARQVSWWDSVDALAVVVGTVVRADRLLRQPLMDEAVCHADLWTRRVAMLHQLGWRFDTDLDRLFGYAERLAHEEDFFIRKAIGWGLRDYAHHDPNAVRDFLLAQGDALSALTRREAAKHLDKQK